MEQESAIGLFLSPKCLIRKSLVKMVKQRLSSSLAGLANEAEQQKRSRAVERKNHTESSLHNTHVLFAQDKQFAQCTVYIVHVLFAEGGRKECGLWSM